jgi:hypothetical protein
MRREAVLAGLMAAVAAIDEAQAECVPSLIVEGPDELRRALEALLPLPVRGQDSCPPLRVTLRQTDDGILVEVVDATGQHAQAEVSDVRVAAVWVRSWLADDFSSPLWPRGQAPRPEPPAASPPDWTVRAQAGVGLSDDRTVWSHGQVGACHRLGPVCVGAAVTAGAQTATQFRFGATAAYDRRDVAGLATVAWPVDSGALHLTPEAGLGVGWLSTTRHESGTACDEFAIRPCSGADGLLHFGDGLAAGTISARVALGVRAGVSLGAGLVLELALGGQLAVNGHHEPLVPDQDFVILHRLANAEIASLPAEPRFAGSIALSLAWRGP